MSNWFTGSISTDPCLAGGGEMGERMRRLDWSQTATGPPERWPRSLRTAVNICLNSRFPMFVWWGTEYTMLYNDAYAPILGRTKHPQWLGRSGRECWRDVWDVVGPLVDKVMASGAATWSEDLLLIMDRNVAREETYFTFSYSPIVLDSGKVGGIFCAVTETTERVVAERRLGTLSDLGAFAAEANTVDEACKTAARILTGNPADIPFAAIYLLEERGGEGHFSVAAGTVPESPVWPPRRNLGDDGEDSGWPLAQVAQSQQAVLVDGLRARFDSLAATSLADGGWPNSPWPGDPGPEWSDAALLLPIAAGGQGSLVGVLVAGLSSRLVYDAEYRAFLDLVTGHIATAINNARAYQAEHGRAEVLVELDRAKTAFFSNVSHEFRTPLMLILGPLEDSLNDRDNGMSPAHRERLTFAHRNAVRLLKLVNTLLDFSRIEAGRAEAVYEPVDLAKVTADLVSVFRTAVERAGLTLQVDCPALPERIYVDFEMWEKIVLNLVSNAYKFTFEGQIAVSLAWRGDAVELSVADTGSGIPVAEQAHLFKRFHRVHGARSRTHEGSGIGLALVHELIRLHGGEVAVESAEGRGTTFMVRIPAGYAHLPPGQVSDGARADIDKPGRALSGKLGRAYGEEALRWLPDVLDRRATERGEAAAAAPAAALAGDAKRSRILLADDNADMRDYVRRLLDEYWVVEAVPDGAAALRAARMQPPDLVLSDVMMPELDGFGLLRELRADPRLSLIPVILLSARAGEEARIEGMEAGADDYLVKPFSARELIARVKAHLKLAAFRERASHAVRQSEQRFRSLALATASIVWSAARNGAMNEDVLGWQVYTGQTPAQYQGWGWIDALHPDDRQTTAQTWRAAMRAGNSAEATIRLRRHDGEYRYLRTHAVPVRDAQGAIREWIGTSVDVHEFKLAQDVLANNERVLRLATGALNALVYEWDITTDEVRRGEGLKAVLGFAVEEVPPTARWWMKRIHDDDRPAVDEAFARGVAAPDGNCVAEYRILDKQGRYVWLSDRSTIIRDAGGKPVRLVGCAVNIDAARRAEEAVRESEEKYRVLIDVAPQWVWIADENLRLRYLNQRGLDYCGLTPEQAMSGGPLWAPIVHREDYARVRTAYEHSRRTGAPYEVDMRLKRAVDGEYRWYLSRALPIRDAAGRIIRWLGASTDIHERKEAEVAIRESEQRFRVLANNVPALIWLNAPDGTMQFANKEYVRFAGRTLEELQGDRWAELIYRDDAAAYVAGYQELLGQRRRFEADLRLRRVDGEYRWMRTVAVPNYSRDGSFLGYIGFTLDIHDRKRAEEGLRISERRFRTLADSLPTLVWTARPDGYIDYVNRQWEEFTGLSNEESQGDGWIAAVYPEYRRLSLAAWKHAAAAGKPYEGQVRNRCRATGEYRWFLVRAVPVENTEGEVSGWFGIATDIHEQKLETESLQEAGRRKDEFLAMLSHELRNPLAPIRNAIEVLRRVGPGQGSRSSNEPGSSNKQFEWAREVIDRQVHQLSRLVDDLFDVSRITRNLVQLNKASVKLNAVLEQAIETSLPLITEREQQLHTAFAGERLELMGDATRLSQIFTNLLNNAAKYTGMGGNIWLTADRDGGEVVLRVRDDGIGIAPALLSRVFDLFIQAENTLDRAQGGLGIGLTVVRKLAVMHGGSVEVFSAGPGKGSEFVVRLPLLEVGESGIGESGISEAEIGEAGIEEAGIGEVGPLPAGAVEASAQERRILVVDDNVDAADSMAMMLELEGHVVRTAHDGESAVEAALDFKPDTVLLDIGLPKMNGYQVAQHLRTSPATARATLIALTGYGQAEDRRRSAEAGFDFHLVKPVYPDQLKALLAERGSVVGS